jgi:hypothetical protein
MPLPALPLWGMLFNWKKMVGLAGQAFAFFIKHWRECLIVLLLAGAWYQNTQETRWVFFVDTIPYYKVQYEEAMIALDVAVEANETLTAAIEATNKQVEEWMEVSIQLEKDNAALSGELKGLRQSTLDQVEDILAGPTPVGCEAAIDFLREGIPELQYDNGVELP